MNSPIKIIKNRSDIGAGTRGSDMGIDALEIAAILKKNHYFNLHPYQDVETHNESIYDKDKSTFAKRIGHVYEQCARVATVVTNTLLDGSLPIVLSGDHSSALGTMSGIKAAFPEKQLGVVWIDAHADIHSPYTSPSGNVHGMPLAAALHDDNLAYKINELKPETFELWQNMKDLAIAGPKLLPQHLVYFGVRDTEEAEDKQIQKLDIRNYTVHEVRFRGLQVCMQEAIEKLSNCDLIYVSYDVDSMDCDLVSYGTGTPVAKGFDPTEITEIISALIQTQKVVCLEIAEINPLLDTKGNKMAETAFDVLDKVTTMMK